MKWIGQHIYDLISRFRSDVYLEDISTGTIASGGNLGLDSNNKIVKDDGDGVTDLHGAGVDGSSNQLLTDDGDGTVTSEANLTFDGETLSVEADSNTTHPGLFIDANSLTTGSAIKIDIDDALTASATKSLILIDYDKAGVTADSQGSITTGLDINMADAATNHANGQVVMYGVDVVLDAASNQGTISQYGYKATLTDGDADRSVGYSSFVENGGVDFVAHSSADGRDYFQIATGAAGATTLTTNDFTVGETAHFEIAADGDITLDAAGVIYLEADSTQLTSPSSNDPLLLITNTTDDASGARIKLYKNRGADGQDGDSCGLLQWTSFDDGTPSGQLYGQIETTIHDATNTQESGKMELGVANHDGGMGAGLTLTGGSADDEIDVVIGLGANSVTTLAGTLTMGSTYAMDNSGLLRVANQSNITGLGTIGTGVWEGTAIASDQQKHLMHYNTTGYSNGSTEYQISEAMNVNPVGSVEHDTNIGSDGLTGQTVQTWLRSGGHVMPRACVLRRWSGWSTSPTTGDDPTYGLFKVTLEDDVDSDPSAELITEMQIVASGNPIANFATITTASSGDAADLIIAAGDIVFFAIKGGGSWIYFNGTFEVEF